MDQYCPLSNVSISSIIGDLLSGISFHRLCVPGSPAPSVTWWKDGSVFDDTYELVEKQANGASNSTVIVHVDGYFGDGVTVVLNK